LLLLNASDITSGFSRLGARWTKSRARFSPACRQPVPSEDTLHPHHQIVTVRGDDPQKRLGGGGQILLDQLRAVLIEDTDVHGACM
jgi:hypothetical protein